MGDDREPPENGASPVQRIPGVERLMTTSLLLLGGLTVAATFWWHLTIERTTLLVLGGSSLCMAWLVWRYSLISYSHESSFEGGVRSESVEARTTPISRAILAPALVLVGLGLVLAATSIGVGGLLRAPVWAAVMIVRLGALLWELALSAVFLVVLVSCAISGAKKRKWAMVVVPVALVGILGVGNLLFYLAWPEVSRRAWDDYLEPFHYVIDLLR